MHAASPARQAREDTTTTMRKPLFFTQHAQDTIGERLIEIDWIERTVREPEWTAADPKRQEIERRFRTIPEFGNRVPRVACYETTLEIRIITIFFDRRAKLPS